MADPSKAFAAGANQRGQDRLDAAAQRQIRVSDDAGACPGFATDSAAAHCRDAIGELGLPDGAHFLGALLAVHRARLHVHRRDDIVAAAGIEQQVLGQIPPSRALPQMVMRIDDRQFRFENRFFAPIEPIPANRVRWRGRLLGVCAPRPNGRGAAEESGEFASVH